MENKYVFLKKNVGAVDSVIRIVLGLAIIAAGVIYFGSWWGLIGLVPLATGTIRWCAIYALLKVSTANALRRMCGEKSCKTE
jgi:hypothetical protein